MNRLTLAGALLALGASPAALAAAPADVPKHRCEPKPVLPGQRMMQDESVRKRFQRELEAYKTCMKEYLDERNAAAKAHGEAAAQAVEEYNATMKALQDAQANR